MEKPLTEGKSKSWAACHPEPLWVFFFIFLCFAGLILIAIYKISPLSSLFSLLFSLQTLLQKVLVWSQFLTVSSRKRKSLSSVILFIQFMVLVQVVFRSSQSKNTNELDFFLNHHRSHPILRPIYVQYSHGTLRKVKLKTVCFGLIIAFLLLPFKSPSSHLWCRRRVCTFFGSEIRGYNCFLQQSLFKTGSSPRSFSAGVSKWSSFVKSKLQESTAN